MKKPCVKCKGLGYVTPLGGIKQPCPACDGAKWVEVADVAPLKTPRKNASKEGLKEEDPKTTPKKVLKAEDQLEMKPVAQTLTKNPQPEPKSEAVFGAGGGTPSEDI